MRKISLLVACVATLLVLSNMNFVAAETAAPSATCECNAVPYVYPPAAHNKVFGNRLAKRHAPEAVSSESAKVYTDRVGRLDARRAARNVPYFVVAPPVTPQEECESVGSVKAPIIDFNFLSAVRGPLYSHPLHVGGADTVSAVVGQGGEVKAPVVRFNFLSAVRGTARANEPVVCTCPK